MIVMGNISKKWIGLRYPDSDLVSLLYRAIPISERKGNAIDVGCGSGRHVSLLNDFGFSTIGIESDVESYEMARSNNINVIKASLENYIAKDPIKLMLFWGVTPLGNVVDIKSEMTKFKPKYIVCDWRTPLNSFLNFPANSKLGNKEVIVRQKDHTLDGLHYRYHDRIDLDIEGYKKTLFRTITKEDTEEVHQWYHTVYERV